MSVSADKLIHRTNFYPQKLDEFLSTSKKTQQEVNLSEYYICMEYDIGSLMGVLKPIKVNIIRYVLFENYIFIKSTPCIGQINYKHMYVPKI
jgi:hypothetical protein